MKNKSIKRNQLKRKNKTTKSYKYVASGGVSSLLSNLPHKSPFQKPDTYDNVHDLKVILNGFYYGYKFKEDISDDNIFELGLGLSNDLKKKVDVAIMTISGDEYQINYLASDEEISGQSIISPSPSTPPIMRQFQVINHPNNTNELDTFKAGIQHVYNGFKAPKSVSRVFKTRKYKERENIEIAIIHKEDDAYKIEFLKEQPYEATFPMKEWEFMINE